jgi:tripartite-type tricarboxylate transporter receptor subunit TctC
VNKLLKSALSAVMAVAAGISQAQVPAGRTITLVVPTTVGTGSDIAARLVGPRLAKRMAQPVIVDNKTGASGIIGMNAVAKAAPDGSMVLFVPNTIAMISSLTRDLPFDPVKDFAPVARVGRMPVAVVVNPSVAAKSINELVALAKSKPGGLNYGSPGNGTPHHLRAEMLKQITGTNIVHVPYKGSAGAVTGLVAGEVQVGLFPLHSVLPLTSSGKLRMLATTGESRSRWTPEVPTFRESGINGLNDYDWLGVFSPVKTPRDIVDRMSREILAILPELQDELASHGIIANPGGPDDLAALLRKELVEWKKTVEDGGIVAN